MITSVRVAEQGLEKKVLIFALPFQLSSTYSSASSLQGRDSLWIGDGDVCGLCGPIQQGSGLWSLLNLDVNLLKMSSTCETHLHYFPLSERRTNNIFKVFGFSVK